MLYSKTSPLFRFAQRFHPSENTLLLILAVLLGSATGIGIWVFRFGIEFFHEVFHHLFPEPVLGGLSVILTLVVAGLMVGWLMQRFVGEERHHGVAGIIEAAALGGGRLRYWRMPYKALVSMITLGADASLGPEDPSVQIGSNIGSFFGQRLGLSDERMRLLLAAGAASAVAAAFEAPIAGVFFALEVILGEFTTRAFGVVVLAAVLASATMQAIQQVAPLAEPPLNLLNYTLGSLLELPLFALMGLLLAPVAVLYIRTIYGAQDVWHRYIHLPRPLQTALAGMLIGVIGLYLPDALGIGRGAMNAVLARPEEFTLGLLLLLGFFKIFANSIALAGGFIGGIFAPTLFVGLMLGGAFGRVVEQAGIGATSDPQAYAIVGMAAMLAGVVRSPITAIMLVFELTDDYRLILPIMLAAVVCILLAERHAPLGIYGLGLARKGVHLTQGRDVDVMQGVTVGEAMTTPAPTIAASASLLELRDALRQHNIRSLCVLEGDELVGIVTLADLQKAYETRPEQIEALTVGDICTREVITAYPDEVLWTAIRKMSAHDVGRLPVISYEGRQVLGILSRHSIVQAYNTAIARKLQAQHRAEQIRLNTLTGAHVFEVRVGRASPLAGQALRQVEWPPESVVASVRRKGKLLIPHGSTQLQPGDLVTVVAAPEVVDDLAQLFDQTPVEV